MLPLEALLENPILPLPASGGTRCSLAMPASLQSLPVFTWTSLLSLLRTLIIGFRGHPGNHHLKIINDVWKDLFPNKSTFTGTGVRTWGSSFNPLHSTHYKVYAKFSLQAPVFSIGVARGLYISLKLHRYPAFK